MSSETGTKTTRTKVLIIGGGIGGLTLAIICKRLEIPCVVLERAKKLTPQGAGISIAPNALKVLDQLGLFDEITSHGQKLRTINVYRNETMWRPMDFTWIERDFGYSVYSIGRHRFHRALYEAAGGPDVVRLDSNVVDMVDDAGVPFVSVTTGSGDVFTADLVVGADGIRSITRRLLAFGRDSKEMDKIRFTGRVHMSGYTTPIANLGEKELGVGTWIFYDDGILTTWPCKDNRQWYIGVKMADPKSEISKDRSVWGNTTTDTINEVYGENFHPFAKEEKFKSIVDCSERVIASNVWEEVQFPTMATGRVALLGDAAHSMTSFFGQGGCQAIEDAVELGNILSEIFAVREKSFSKDTVSPSQADVKSALQRYCHSREKRAKDLVEFSSNFAALHTARLPYGLGPMVRKIVYAYLPTWIWSWSLQWLYGYQPTINALPAPSPRKQREPELET